MFRRVFKNIPQEIKTISRYTSIFYFGWGFVEAFIPIFLFSFVNSYAQTGILKSVYDIVFFLSAPIIGYLADRISTKKIIMVGICFYPLISISYVFAGITSVAAFIVLARILNGMSNAMMGIGRGTYFYHCAPGKIATSIGFFDSLTNISWISSLMISVLLVRIIPIHYLFLGIIPGSIIALLVARRLPEIKRKKTDKTKINFSIYKNMFSGIRRRKPFLRTLVIISVVLSMVATAFEFFVPIEVYQNNHNLLHMAIFAIVFNIPPALSFLFGSMIDEDRGKRFIFSCISIIAIFVLSYFFHSLRWYLIAIFLFGIAVEMIDMEISKLVGKYCNKENYGNITGIMASLDDGLGIVLGPIIIGLCIDIWGMGLAMILMSVLIVIILILFGIKILPKYDSIEE